MFFSKSNRWRTENKQKGSSIVLTWVSYKNNLDTLVWKQVFCYRSWLLPAVLHASNFFQMCSHLNILLSHTAAPWSPYFLLEGIYLPLTPCHALGIRKAAKIMLAVMCPQCVSWCHLQCLEQCLGHCDNSIAGCRFWKTAIITIPA